MAPERKIATRSTKTQNVKKISNNQNDNINIDALINEISSLKKAIAVKEEKINGLVSERDQIKNDKDALNAEHEQIQQQLAKSTEKIKELETERTILKKEITDLNDDVINSLIHERDEIGEWRRKETKQLAGKINELEKEREFLKKQINEISTDKKKAYNAAVKTSDTTKITEAAYTQDSTKTKSYGNANSTDSGITVQSLTQLIDHRVNLMINDKLKKCDLKKADEGIWEQTEHLTPKIKKEATYVDANRERNIVIHGLRDGENDGDLVKDIFSATATQHAPVTMYRLGPKKTNTTRPLLLRMKTIEEKDEFMSRLWMLKNLKMKYGKMSITNDHTLEERRMIKEHVQEANKRNTEESKEFKWKVRGSPKDGLKIIRIRTKEE